MKHDGGMLVSWVSEARVRKEGVEWNVRGKGGLTDLVAVVEGHVNAVVVVHVLDSAFIELPLPLELRLDRVTHHGPLGACGGW